MTIGSNQEDASAEACLFAPHQHDACINEAIATVEARCKSENLRLTSVRRKTLEILLQEHRPLGAYAVLERLRAEGFGPQPPVAYRALDFLVTNGFAHKIERLNAFIACLHPSASHSPAFMICRICDAVVETRAAMSLGPLSDVAAAAGFQIESTLVEAEGVCPACVGRD